jgi:P pilus assembly chaperone PapD
MNHVRAIALAALLGAADFLNPLDCARAELVLSQLVIELSPGENARADVEAWNNGKDRIFVSVDPREILHAGTTTESSRTDPDPEKLGLLVSPSRMILEPGQRKLLRIASIADSGRERIYRVTVKPVVGQLSSQGSGLKVLVGYDMLILARPAELKPHVSASRSKDQLIMRNDGNVSVELVDGRACDAAMRNCEDLPSGRLYAGAERIVKVAAGHRAQYKLRIGAKLTAVDF